jgi:hypothetical protein
MQVAAQLDDAIEDDEDGELEAAYVDARETMHEALGAMKDLCEVGGFGRWFAEASNKEQAEALIWMMQERGDNY